MVNYSPQLDQNVFVRLDNALAICDTEFLLHPGFPEFATRYFTRPFSTCLLILSGVEEDLKKSEVLYPDSAERVATAKKLIKSLIDAEYCEVNATYAERSLSVHGQIMRSVDGLRTNHRVCVLTNNSRTIESLAKLRKEHRKEARGISCLRMSRMTGKPMVPSMNDPEAYASNFIGCRTESVFVAPNSLVGTPSFKEKEFYIREVNLSYRTTGHKKIHISNQLQVADFARTLMTDNSREHSIALYVDESHYIVNYALLSIGIATQVYMSPPEVFQRAFATGAHGIVLVHNHPNGSLVPSAADKNSVKRFQILGVTLGIPVVDHMIMTESGFVSHSSNPWK